jgi:hypothetical protein
MRKLWYVSIYIYPQNPSHWSSTFRAYQNSQKQVTRVFPLRNLLLRAHEAAYLVSLWQLDLERAETAEVPRWPPKDVLKS